MGMSTYIKGLRPPDEKWKKMKGVWDACEKAGIAAPDEVDDFFEWNAPDNRGIEINLEKFECVKDWRDKCSEGFEVDISELPKNITHIRFYNSW